MRPYVVVDVETTGLDAYHDTIIQVAMLRSDGKTLASFVNPGRPVPDEILRLTGFLDVDFSAHPTISDMRPRIEAFLEGFVVVGHNVSFDIGFLARAGVRVHESLDTLAWSRLAFPLKGQYRLTDFFPESWDKAHDARVDVEMTEDLLQQIFRSLTDLPPGTQADLAQLLGDEWRWWDVPHSTEEVTLRSPLDNPEPDPPSTPSPEPMTVESSPSEWLSPAGPVSRALPGYEIRESQTQMLDATQAALESGQVLLVEAGTGTGKSLAYLTPAIFQALEAGERVVVATHTVALQEQLWQKDVPLARQEIPAEVALLKGRGRYLCLLKADQVRAELPTLGASREERWALAQLLTFIAQSEGGDADEFRGYGEASRVLWKDVVADSEACAGARCPYAGPCFLRRSRRRAEASHLVIVNHALLAAHLANGKVLPAFDHVVIDEAHHLAEVVERAFGMELDIAQWIRQAREIDGGRHGLLERLRTHPDLFGPTERFRAALASVTTQLAQLATLLISETPASEYDRRTVRITEDVRGRMLSGATGLVLEEISRGLATCLEAAIQMAETRALVYGHSSLDDPLWLRFKQWQDDLKEVARGVARWSRAESEWVSWWEVRTGREGELLVTLRTAPVEVAPILRESLWDTVSSAILTSATLSVRGRFDYVASSLGVPTDRMHTLKLSSPFDFGRQARLYIPEDAPDPKAESYMALLADFVRDAARVRMGRTLVLLTSNQAVRAVSWRIRDELLGDNIVTLAQGVDGPAQRLVRDFQQMPSAVLLGTMSLWEGVDVPGSKLECVIMGRLPFRSLGDPLEEARHERIRAEGASPFYRRSLPEAILRFQQGFGRLIRTSEDKGVVVVFDPRISPSKTRYGRHFLESLPEVPLMMAPISDLIREMRQFWQAEDAVVGPPL